MGAWRGSRGYSSPSIHSLACRDQHSYSVGFQHGALAWQNLEEGVTMPRTDRLSGTAKALRTVKAMKVVSSRLTASLLMLSVVTVVAACAQQGPESGPSSSGSQPPAIPIPSATVPAATESPAAVTPPSASGIDLTITLTESPEAMPRTFRLVAEGATPGPESTLPDPAAALAAVEKYGEKMFFPVPDPNRVCTQQYGGPEIAQVTGWFHGKEVNATFKRTDGCEISQWQALAPLFGALGGGTGNI